MDYKRLQGDSIAAVARSSGAAKAYVVICRADFAGGTDVEIGAEEFAQLLAALAGKPEAPAGFDYRLKTDGSWELCALPPEPEAEAEPADYEAALAALGVI